MFIMTHAQSSTYFTMLPVQENLLLDDESNIKLIDFGLVADPDVCMFT